MFDRLFASVLVGTCIIAHAVSAQDVAREVVRGLKTVLIEETDSTVYRRYPSVLIPADVSTLSFEIGGKLEAVNLSVGQVVAAGDVLAVLDETAMQRELQRAIAAVEQAQAQATNASEALIRNEELLKRGSVTRVAVDNARTTSVSATSTLEQAQTTATVAEDNLTKTQLLAPFDGTINTVDVESFSNVAAGTSVATLYQQDTFEVKFTVNFDIVNMLVLGKEAKIRLAARPSTVLTGTVTEIGARADQVSSFPVVITVTDAPSDVRAGMAVEAELDFSLITTPGYSIPLSSIIGDGELASPENPLDPVDAQVYLFDEATSTVKRHTIKIFGVRQNQLLVAEGLAPGDHVASAGIPFLRDGMRVKLLAQD